MAAWQRSSPPWSNLPANTRERAGQKVDTLQLALSERFENSEFASERIRALIHMRKFQDRRLLAAFPRMRSTKYTAAFEKIRPHILGKKNKDNASKEDIPWTK